MNSPVFDVQAMVELVRTGRMSAFVEQAEDLEPADLADVLAQLDDAERVQVVQLLPPEISSHALVEMPAEEHAGETLAALDPGQAAGIVDELEDDDAADLLGELDPAEQERILSSVEDRSEVDRLLRYDEDSAGGLMTTHLVRVQETDTVAEALDRIRRQTEEVEDFYELFVVDAGNRLVGTLPLKGLVTSLPARPVREFIEEADITVSPEVDQEEVARVMGKYHMPSLPVVDGGGRLIGRITFDDVAHVVQQETTEDLLKFGGVSGGEELSPHWVPALRSRLPWLLINLLTAFVAKSVIDAQQDVVNQIPLIAGWLGVIAGMGGNAGTQALAVTVRRLALGLIGPGDAKQIIRNELLVGLLNGIVNGLIVAAIGMGTGGQPLIGLVVGLAMVGNLVVAAASGAIIPLLLQRFKVDPAIASSIFVTTFTDVFGFGLVLLFARLLLLH
ncbi:MAG: magnesium transporter [Gemmatimonadota bacterium]